MAAATYFTAGAAAPALAGTLGTTGAGIVAGAGSGALFGGLGAAMQGGDVGKGALFGGLGGAITGGMGGYDNVYGAAAATPNPAAAVNPNAPVDPNLFGPPNPANPNLVGNPNLQGPVPVGPPTPSGTPGTPGGPPTKEFLESFRPGVPTPSAVDDKTKVEAAKTIYQGFGPGASLSKAATLALPGIGGAMSEKPEELPGEEDPYKRRATLSPDFQGYTPSQPNPYYRAQYTRYAAGGGLMDAYQAGGPVERMSMMNTAMNPQGGLYPQGMIDKTQYATPIQRPVSSELVMDDSAYERSSPMLMAAGGDTRKKKRASLTAERTINSLDPYNAALAQLNNARYGANMSGVGALNPTMTSLGELPVVAGAKGGIADLGGYSDGGRMLKGPGDGMSDSIPATIGGRQPARLADGEFVVPADVVSHLGNGSTDAGAKKLYAMMDKIRKARTGKKKQAPAVNTGRFMPA
ncbi:MAG: hypothetical protein ACOYNN_13515 [Terrimicrobiaceae bacterium]